MNEKRTTQPMDESERGGQPGAEATETAKTAHNAGHDSDTDVHSDPARDDRVGSDWSDEGGAAPTGPATSSGAPITLDPPD